jgi:hypothetical protein
LISRQRNRLQFQIIRALFRMTQVPSMAKPAATAVSEHFHNRRPPSLLHRYYWRRKLININAGHASTPMTGSKPPT